MTEFNQEKFDGLTEGLIYSATFIPRSQSHNKDEKHPTVNWRINLSLQHHSWCGDYSIGLGCLSEDNKRRIEKCVGTSSFVGRKTIDQHKCEQTIIETGKIPNPNSSMGFGSVPLDKPALRDVIASLLMDSEAIDSGGFEEWASDLGYDTDSRKAEAIYRACVDTGLKMRLMFGDAAVTELRELFQDY